MVGHMWQFFVLFLWNMAANVTTQGGTWFNEGTPYLFLMEFDTPNFTQLIL